MSKTPMLLKTQTLDCKFMLADGLERDLFSALQAAHIDKGSVTSTNGQDFEIQVSEFPVGDINEVDLVVVIGVQQGATDPVYHEKRKIVALKSGSSWSVFRDITTTNRDLFKNITIAVNTSETTMNNRLTFTVSGLDSTATETTFKYFTQIKM